MVQRDARHRAARIRMVLDATSLNDCAVSCARIPACQSISYRYIVRVSSAPKRMLLVADDKRNELSGMTEVVTTTACCQGRKSTTATCSMSRQRGTGRSTKSINRGAPTRGAAGASGDVS